ncbi:MAG: glutamate synthase subunit beta [Candidatus Sumerlaeia bacterium]|nr:glutamate synthase subunit beta [Candidatus Sumerlaeia bacterium]
MGKTTGFLEYEREAPGYRPVEERVRDWKEVTFELPDEKKKAQAARCMDCGVPFCNQGCPLGNLIPDWNDLVYRNLWKEAIVALHKTNNFPEFTGRICPAPCEAACVLGINDSPVTIKQIENSIIERAFAEGWIKPEPPSIRTGKTVAIVGSGPAGLAAAQQLNRAGHLVTVFEREKRVGGLLTFGIPDFKLEKSVVDRRIAILEAEGISFQTGVTIGKDITMDELRSRFSAVLLCNGATLPRDVRVPGRELNGILFAMDYLTAQNYSNYGDADGERYPLVSAKDKHVIIIGGGDTGADCYGTAIRQGAKSVTQLEYNMRPPEERPSYNPWPQWPLTFYSLPAHYEGGKRDWCVMTKKFSGKDGKNVDTLHAIRLDWENPDAPKRDRKMIEVPGSDFELPADLVLLAIGFSGPEKEGPISQLGLELDRRGNVKIDENFMTSQEGVFAAGDTSRGQSLVVWAIADGRKAARGVDQFLMGFSDLPG